jgi:hypothetical protein
MNSLLTDILKLNQVQILELSDISMGLTLSAIKNGEHETAKYQQQFNDIYYFAYNKNWSKVNELIEGITK